MYVLRKRAYFGKIIFKEPDTGKVHIRIVSKNSRQVVNFENEHRVIP